jgi:hypothetical protein
VALPIELEQALDRAAIARNRRRILALNDRHLGATVFVVGSSPQLNRLSEPQIERLARAPAIGLNRTQYRVPTMYFLASHTQEVGLARRVGGASAVIHLHSPPPGAIPGTLAVWKRYYEPDRGLPRRLHGDRPILYNRRNVSLSATHLALIMGARRVVYIGLEQRTKLHFYDTDPALRERIVADLDWVRRKRYHDVASPDNELAGRRRVLRAPAEQLAAMPFYIQDHTPTFRMFFAELERYGVEPVATLKESVVYDAGARFVSLDEAIERFAVPARRRPSRPPLISLKRRRDKSEIRGRVSSVHDG